jgi:YgiT-type zinc finger domain-containing protein
MLPCSECGTDLGRRDCEETTATVEVGIGRKLFGQTTAEREVPAWVCPECGEVTPL